MLITFNWSLNTRKQKFSLEKGGFPIQWTNFNINRFFWKKKWIYATSFISVLIIYPICMAIQYHWTQTFITTLHYIPTRYSSIERNIILLYWKNHQHQKTIINLATSHTKNRILTLTWFSMHSLDTATKQFLMHCRLPHLELLLCLLLIRRRCGKAVKRI